jgi:hypothetical protein
MIAASCSEADRHFGESVTCLLRYLFLGRATGGCFLRLERFRRMQLLSILMLNKYRSTGRLRGCSCCIHVSFQANTGATRCNTIYYTVVCGGGFTDRPVHSGFNRPSVIPYRVITPNFPAGINRWWLTIPRYRDCRPLRYLLHPTGSYRFRLCRKYISLRRWPGAWGECRTLCPVRGCCQSLDIE